MLLSDLLSALSDYRVIGNAGIEVKGLAENSKKVDKGSLFVCMRGTRDDGHRYVREAVERGAAVLVSERPASAYRDLPQVIVPNPRQALARLADRFYGSPSRSLKVIGVTGTNGKTTTTYLIEAILKHARHKTAVVGTIAYRLGKKTLPSPNTTPSSLELQRLMAQMVAGKFRWLVMEVSSHALDQGRVESCEFEAAVFTNLTQDHLDYHHSMREYLQAKARLFQLIEQGAQKGRKKLAIFNADDNASVYLKKFCGHAASLTYGFHASAQVRALNWKLTTSGISFLAVTPWGRRRFELSLLGKVNIWNALAAIATCGSLGVSLPLMQAALQRIPLVPGRFEKVPYPKGVTVVVDYAHTPDALAKLLDSARELCKGRLLLVFGCGGNRDRTKRPLMGEIASQKSDLCLITSDNPRDEDPLFIMKEIEKGIVPACRQKKAYEMVVDRRQAIGRALSLAHKNDLVLIAGKGHEATQTTGKTVAAFSDQAVVKQFARKNKNS